MAFRGKDPPRTRTLMKKIWKKSTGYWDYWRSTSLINKPWFINPGLTLIISLGFLTLNKRHLLLHMPLKYIEMTSTRIDPHLHSARLQMIFFDFVVGLWNLFSILVRMAQKSNCSPKRKPRVGYYWIPLLVLETIDLTVSAKAHRNAF